MMHNKYISYMSSEKVVALGLPPLGVRFLAGRNSSNVSGTPNFRIVRQLLKSKLSQLVSDITDSVLAKPSVLFELGYQISSRPNSFSIFKSMATW